jgi:hypothetical protein
MCFRVGNAGRVSAYFFLRGFVALDPMAEAPRLESYRATQLAGPDRSVTRAQITGLAADR